MNYEDVKNTLNAYLKKLRLVNTYKELMNRALEDATALQAIDYSKDRVNSSNGQSIQDRAVERIESYRGNYERLCDELFRLEDIIRDMLPLLNEVEQGLIIDRYLQGASFMELSRKYFYGYEVLKNKFTKIYNKIGSGYQK